jgi:UDP-N-acetylglucosamine--N-acetylmuramyl-(pentapeptide) pyrophosphoryl-undecaprenol N-acetylglucosamine transferase
MNPPASQPHVAIACGGTGGHLFPGVAVGRELLNRGAAVTLFVSTKEVDRQAVAGLPAAFGIETLPAVGLSRGRAMASALNALRSARRARACFRARPTAAVLAMGGFTSLPVVLAGRSRGAVTFLHESNTIPGRANRWLAPWVSACFVGFEEAAPRLRNRHVTVTGTPVRGGFVPTDPAAARVALGLDPDRPVLLVVGGSQGAEGVNRLVSQSLPRLLAAAPELQVFHIAGTRDVEAVRAAAAPLGSRVRVVAFHLAMDLALAAATVAVSRSGASSLAEFAAMRLPSVLIPFPAATDDHQRANARAMVRVGAARLLEQVGAGPDDLVREVLALTANPAEREAMSRCLAGIDAPGAAGRIAERVMTAIGAVASPVRNPGGLTLNPPRTRETLA